MKYKVFAVRPSRIVGILVLIVLTVIPPIMLTGKMALLRDQLLSYSKASNLERSEDLLPAYGSSASYQKYKISNIYFLKFYKAGSTTMYNIFARYAWEHDLRVATYAHNVYMRYKPGCLISYLHPPFKEGENERYNFVLDHSFYEPDDIGKILHHPITYVSMIRHPISWLESYVRFKNWTGILQLNDSDVVSSFLDKISTGKHEIFAKHIVDFTNNLFMLKSVNRQHGNSLEDIDKRFLIGIYEYYDESLILMRRTFNWTFTDILYSPLRVQLYHRKAFDRSIYKRLCEFMPDQCFFYEHFNKSFTKRIQQEGQTFFQEVKYLKSVLNRIAKFCYPVFELQRRKIPPQLTAKPLEFNVSVWHDEFTYSHEDCLLSILSPLTFRSLFYYRQNQNFSCDEKLPIGRSLRKKQICRFMRTSDKKSYFNKIVRFIDTLM